MARRRTSYAWATHVDPGVRLSGDAEQGLAYARTLAENNRAWSRLAPRHGRRPFPLSPEELAEGEDVSASTIRRRIAEARYVLFGSLSDSGIYYRLARERERKRLGRRTCRAPDCANPLPRRARASRRYCHPRCRRRHHYQRPLLAARAREVIVECPADELAANLGAIGRLYGRSCDASSGELHDLGERARLSADCPGFTCLVALREGGELVAFAYGRRSEEGQWWWHRPVAQELRRKKKPRRWLRDSFVIGELAVAPEAQGQGFGRALLERLLATPQAQGSAAVLIVLDAVGGRAAGFYRTLGFEEILADFRFSADGMPKRIMGLAREEPPPRT